MTIDKLAQKIGVLGGGQLGKMLCQAGSLMSFNMCFLEKDKNCPTGLVSSSVIQGDITKYEDVISFGNRVDILTIEIENVNIEALKFLESIGKKVFPSSLALEVIKDKGNQKQFYLDQNLPTSKFQIFGGKNDIITKVNLEELSLPFVQKSRTEGYDGKGVHIVRNIEDLANLIDAPCIVEELVDVDKEIAIIVARRPSGEIVTFPAVEMHFHPTANLVDYLFSPSSIDRQKELEIAAYAKSIAAKLNMVGLLAVEFFLTKTGDILINEVAPRPHNSGHHTIEACNVSQYDLHLRAICDLPLIEPYLEKAAVMVNVLGEVGYDGPVSYSGISNCLEIDGVHPHFYGKTITKPFRKMGHVTIIDNTLDNAIIKSEIVRSSLKAISINE